MSKTKITIFNRRTLIARFKRLTARQLFVIKACEERIKLYDEAVFNLNSKCKEIDMDYYFRLDGK